MTTTQRLVATKLFLLCRREKKVSTPTTVKTVKIVNSVKYQKKEEEVRMVEIKQPASSSRGCGASTL